MKTIRNNHVFKGHKTLLGNRYVTYGEVELPLRYDLYSKSKNGFDWGYNGSGPIQLAFSMLYQLSDEEFAKKNASKFAEDVIKTLTSRDWILNASEIIQWIERHSETSLEENTAKQKSQQLKIIKKIDADNRKKSKTNIVKDICKEIGITQKNLAEILEVPEGTVSSWAVKNEIPRLGKKAIEFYMLNRKNQDIVDSYKNFVKLLNVS